MPGARFYAAGFLGSLASGLHLVTQAKVAFEALLGKTSLLHGRTYRAPRLGPMTAVRETAGFGKFFDIGKCKMGRPKIGGLIKEMFFSKGPGMGM